MVYEWKNVSEWIGVDLDGTLADFSEGWKGIEHIGKPLWPMVNRVKGVLADGMLVKILTARANDPNAIPYVKKWLVEEAGLPELEITNIKGHNIKEIWDDKARQVVPNTGEFVVSDAMHELLEKAGNPDLSSKDEDADMNLNWISDYFNQQEEPEES